MANLKSPLESGATREGLGAEPETDGSLAPPAVPSLKKKRLPKRLPAVGPGTQQDSPTKLGDKRRAKFHRRLVPRKEGEKQTTVGGLYPQF
jgi:hypothetical protein